MTRSTFWVYPYKMQSEGAIAIRDALGGKFVLREGSQYRFQDGDCLINWGCGECPYPQALNANVNAILNKRKFFERLSGTCLVPPFGYSRRDAAELRFPVVCRTSVEGRDGQGIHIAETVNDLVDARLYVQLIEKQSEWRVHVGRVGAETIIIGYQKKIRQQDDERDPRIWTGESTLFSWRDSIPSEVRDACVETFNKFPELTFAAFDAIQSTDGIGYVLEANSAPMMTPRTATLYKEFFERVHQERRSPTPVEEETSITLSASVYEENVARCQAAHEQRVGETFDRLMRGELTLREVVEGYLGYQADNP